VSKGKIPTEVLETIRERIPVERVVGEYVPLKRAGRHFKGLCPFHQEKTPSFLVNTDLQIFKCFGCGESGNIFGFLMKFENISFMEAVERLAQQAGVELPSIQRETPQEKSEKDILISTMKKAWRIYHECLLKSPEGSCAREYLTRRGYDLDDIHRYGFGFAPESWDFIITRLNVPVRTLVKAGLVIEKTQ